MKRSPASVFKQLRGQPAWGLTRTVGSMFFLEIGPASPPTGRARKIHGQWYFLFEFCHWRIEAGERLLVGSEDDAQVIDQKFADLELGEITGIRMLSPACDLVMTFDSGMVLRTFRAFADNIEADDLWIFYAPPFDVWSVTGDKGPVWEKL